MKSILRWTCVLILALIHFAPTPAKAQDASAEAAATSLSTMDYPRAAGVLVQGADWTPIPVSFPAKSRAKNGIASSFTYGAVPANIVADYSGDHASVVVDPVRPVFCVCHISSIPGDPLLVKLLPQKGMRELDGGRLTPFKGKVAQAKQSDLVPANVTHPESTVWLVQPQQALSPGEYALMLGAQNVAIYSFTVSAVPGASGDKKY